MSTVLVVDDDPGVRKVFAGYLRPHYPATYVMAEAETAEAQIEAMPGAERGETLVLMDVNLAPGHRYDDGCAAGRAIARRFPTVRFLFISGDEHARMMERCYGLPPYIMKPIKSHELVEIVGMVLATPPWMPPEVREEPHRRARD